VITLHEPDLTHPLKEVDAAAMAVARTPEQVAQLLAYVTRGQLAPCGELRPPPPRIAKPLIWGRNSHGAGADRRSLTITANEDTLPG
jgi:hypothetical protein